jgi:phage tail sheath gpL-like
MSLTGLDPNDPRPGTFREITLGVGESNTSGVVDDVLLLGNKTSDGSETVDTLNDPIQSLSDMIARFGKRSEITWMYRKYVAADPNATIYAIAPAEAGGAAAATRTFTFVTAASGESTLYIDWGGETTSISVSSGDTAIVQAAAFAEAINDASDSSWPMTAVIGGAGSEHIVTVTSANLGTRAPLVLARIRTRYSKTVATVITAGAVGGGTGEDDFTTAYGYAAKGLYSYQASAKHSTSGVTTTDNGIGEHIEQIRTQALPATGKEQYVFFGLVGTQAQATTVATSSAANSARAFFMHVENCPWTPAMMAAHYAAVVRSKQIVYPAHNFDGHTASDTNVFQVPAPYDKADWLTDTEIRADLNNGVTPVAFSARGASSIVRHITSRSLSGSASDYRVRDGHIVRCIDIVWRHVAAPWASTKQNNVAAEPPAGTLPKPKTTYPSAARAMVCSIIDDACSAAPFGIYPGPILDPSLADQMKALVLVTKVSGGLQVSADLRAPELLHKTYFDLRETSPAV